MIGAPSSNESAELSDNLRPILKSNGKNSRPGLSGDRISQIYPGSKGEILIPTKCSPLFSQYQTFGGANLPPTPDFLIVSSGD